MTRRLHGQLATRGLRHSQPPLRSPDALVRDALHHPVRLRGRSFAADGAHALQELCLEVWPMARRSTGRRELINTGTDKRFVRRRADGTFKESADVGRSLAADRPRKASTKSPQGQGDRGDR